MSKATPPVPPAYPTPRVHLVPANAAPPGVEPATVEGWLAELGIAPSARVDRDAVVAWDLELDGRRRFAIGVTVILDPALGLITWVHFAPPIGDGLRKSYLRLLRWNDEFPFVKFSLAEDGRPTLSTEIPLRILDRDELGVALTRSLAICDALLEESAAWLWIGGRIPDPGDRTCRNPALFERYRDRLPELLGS
jgi:Putative bacterial sensory transduction regulator